MYAHLKCAYEIAKEINKKAYRLAKAAEGAGGGVLPEGFLVN